MSASISQLIPELRPWARALVDAAAAARYSPRITSTRRSNAEQSRLYRRFLAGQQGYPVAPPGTSAHEYGYAFDMVLAPMEALEEAGAVWRQWGGLWSPKDAIHFEFPGFQRQRIDRAEEVAPGFLERLYILTEQHPYLSFLLSWVPGVTEIEIVLEVAHYSNKLARYLRGY